MSLSGANRRNVVIAGGGIAGLTSALALQASGFHAIVLERTPAPATQGAGIQISPNALHILDRLGVGNRVREAASAPDAIVIKNSRTAQTTATFKLGASFAKRHGLPYLILHRADLLQALLSACERGGDIELRSDSQVVDFAAHRNGVTVLNQRNGIMEEQSAAALIGADGSWSTVRGLFPSAPKPRDTGYIAWRALLPMEAVPSKIDRRNTGLWLAPDAHIVHYPIRQTRYLNVACIMKNGSNTQATQGWISQKRAKRPFEIPGDWHPDLAALLSSHDAKWGGWPIFDVKKVPPLAHDRLALVGDAAHPMVPFAAQGGTCAIEDAAIIAHHCRQTPDDFESAFSAYARDRKRRVARICRTAHQNGLIYHLPYPLSKARDLTMNMLGQERLQKKMDWLYGWREPEFDA